MGYYAIRTGQVMEHRKWMFRWMAYFTSIITSRITGLIVAAWISPSKSYNTVWTCEEVNYTLEHETHRGGRPGSFPDCGVDSPPSRQVIVPADITDPPLGMASAFRVTVGAGIWLSFALHAFIVEAYLGGVPRHKSTLSSVHGS
ncbi:hypothetical protein CPB86DRAFT_787786 [Serendipita vermifera]|nr:hypothetical protein CPB86DRAFT_787786 [Serendipita vermifera]